MNNNNLYTKDDLDKFKILNFSISSWRQLFSYQTLMILGFIGAGIVLTAIIVPLITIFLIIFSPVIVGGLVFGIVMGLMMGISGGGVYMLIVAITGYSSLDELINHRRYSSTVPVEEFSILNNTNKIGEEFIDKCRAGFKIMRESRVIFKIKHLEYARTHNKMLFDRINNFKNYFLDYIIDRNNGRNNNQNTQTKRDDYITIEIDGRANGCWSYMGVAYSFYLMNEKKDEIDVMVGNSIKYRFLKESMFDHSMFYNIKGNNIRYNGVTSFWFNVFGKKSFNPDDGVIEMDDLTDNNGITIYSPNHSYNKQNPKIYINPHQTIVYGTIRSNRIKNLLLNF